ncbi:MAG: right-handed parallel beta-helix repeat-containing protein [Armatimonadetes bacterium]|nr:right-handed parallel beta-helix repeat-containing protein [Armatimonadota bacterium]
MTAFWLALASMEDVELKSGDVLTKSLTVAKRRYDFENSDETGKVPALTVKGKNIVIDFKGATLQGSKPQTDPDQRHGTGLVIEGENITVKNLNVRGYKLAVLARGVKGLKLEDCDVSYNWKQHLGSTLEREDEADWMSYHHNEKDEWFGYGAGIYLKACKDFEVKGCRATGGQCGLMMTHSSDGQVWNNDFSFLSGLGVGMYRTSRVKVMHNKIDWCVRGYSHGVYNRGQDSAGILVFEQCMDNVFAYNSVTHGGDGYFLWAGQHTMDTGKDGCNGNLLYGNDFSHAPTNGIEATFSKNDFVNNLILECWHGVWGGYSYETKILGNRFGLNQEAIAIEHGQDNTVTSNIFDRDTKALNIWSNERQDPNWGYPKGHDTRSRDYMVSGNEFRYVNDAVMSVRRTNGFKVEKNQFTNCKQLFNLGDKAEGLSTKDNVAVGLGSAVTWPGDGGGNKFQTASGAAPQWRDMNADNLSLSTKDYLAQFSTNWSSGIAGRAPTSVSAEALKQILAVRPAPLKGGMDPFIPEGTLRGRRYILVDEWGPYDFRSPRLWPRKQTTDAEGRRVIEFEVLGPKGRWTVTRDEGIAAVSARSGSVPGTVTATLAAGKATMVDLGLSYVGEATVDYRGLSHAAGAPVSFSYKSFFVPIDWEVQFFDFDRATQDPRTQQAAFDKVTQGTAVYTMKTPKLSLVGGTRPGPGKRGDFWTTHAVGSVEVPAGDYVLKVTSDDGVRVWVDGKLVIDNWTYHGPTLDKAELHLGPGKHKIEVRHFQLDGYGTLQVDLQSAAS